MHFDYSAMAEVIGAWFLALPQSDVLLIIWRPTCLSAWQVQYRVRVYDAEVQDPFSGRDRFVWDRGEAPAEVPRAALVAMARGLMAGLQRAAPAQVLLADEVLVEGDGLALVKAMQGRAWVHIKVMEGPPAGEEGAYRLGRG